MNLSGLFQLPKKYQISGGIAKQQLITKFDETKGYSGVATYAKTGITMNAETSLGEARFDDEGSSSFFSPLLYLLSYTLFSSPSFLSSRLFYYRTECEIVQDA